MFRSKDKFTYGIPVNKAMTPQEALEYLRNAPEVKLEDLEAEAPKLDAILQELTPETWRYKRNPLFAAIVEEGLDHVEADRVLREAAKRVGAPLEALRRAWQDFLGPKKEDATAAKDAVNLALEAGPKLWHTPSKEAWATLPRAGHVEHHPLRGKEFRTWLAGLYYVERGKPLYAQALQDALAVLEAKALFEGEEHEVHTRLAGWEGKVYLDLARPDWSVVEVDPSGWRIIPAHEAPVRFRRGRHQKPLPLPERGGSLAPLLELLPLRERRDVALVLGWLVGALSPQGPYPILVLAGEKGAGKSTAARVLKALVDPQEAALRAEPKDVEALMVGAKGSWVLALDNLSRIPTWLSDALCRLSTGGGLGKRELYSDSEEHVLEAQRPVILTGIGFGILRDDLADRVAMVNLTRLEDGERRPEREIWEAFARAHPQVLGALLDAVVLALRRWEEVRKALPSLPRLADWAVWAEAAAPALGLEAGEVVAAFYEVQAAMEQDTLEADPVAQAILLLTRDWPEGHRREYPTAELLADLEQVMGLKEAKRKPEGWPRTPQGLGKHLPRLQAALRGAGIVIRGERDRRTKRHRWLLERVGGTIAANAANAAKPLQDGTPDCGYCPPSPPPIAAIAAQTPQEETPSGTASAAIAAIAAIDSPLLSKPGGGETWEDEEGGEWL
jgi:energy-coupling factor transporter ATP-binding protein EcfA2